MTDETRNPVPEPTPDAPAGKPQPYEKSAADLRKEEESAFPFSVSVGQVYDGPYDLLLDLVRKQNIDIYDIPIARITAQFLAYVEHLKASDVDTAGEFIYMSALLIHIKSKMLLPRSPAESPEEADDPRRELVERLLEHERFRNAAQMLQQKRQLEEATWTNPGIREFRKAGEDDQDIAADTLDLVRVFRTVLERAKNRPVLDVSEDAITVRQMIDFVRRRLMMEDRPVGLSKLLANSRSVGAVIAMFLALLELVRLQAVLLRQDRDFSEIYVKKSPEFERVITERLNVQDDWR
jgi:segregation and condensation protein A